MKKPSRRPRKSQVTTVTFFGPPPLLEGEDEGAYNDLLARVSGAVNPKDVTEEIWVREAADLTWEILRWRRLKTELMNVRRKDGLMAVLVPIYAPEKAFALADAWVQRKEGMEEGIKQLLESVGLSMDSVWTWILEKNLDTIERIDRMIMTTEARRNAALREIERRRDSLAKRLREVTGQIEEAEFEEITKPKTIGRKAA